MPTCLSCQQSFEVTEKDKQFLDQISPTLSNTKHIIPEPTHCPDCRAQRRMSWRCERKMYHRKCDLCSKAIISMYNPTVKFPVYCPECWWSDSWDAADYAQDFDPNRSFFEQFAELNEKVPHFSMAVLKSTMENSDYTNHAGYLKNCYLVVNSDQSEQCLYSKGANRCFDCVDCFKVYDCEGLYECLNCNNCSFSSYLIDCYNCDECHFSSDLIGCKNCFKCTNLRNAEYHFENKRYTKEEYEQKVTEAKAQKSNQQIQQEFLEQRKSAPKKWMREKNTENVTGEYLVECKDCKDCYDCEYLENSKYCTDLKKGDKVSFNNYDISYFGMGIESSYECSVGGYNANHTLFCENVWDGNDIYYSQICMNRCHDLFGCVGLKHKNYSILNKQYSKEDYESLASQIIEHMKQSGEWGEFFPSKLSPHGYNETTAFEYYPLTKEQALSKGLNWVDETEPDYSNVKRKVHGSKMPNTIDPVTDEILDWAIECIDSGRLFKIQPVELKFYKNHKIPIPQKHPDARYMDRLNLRQPRTLNSKNCTQCGSQIQTSIEDEAMCQKCYNEKVY